MFEKCMKDIMFRYSVDASSIQKGLHLGCVTLRLCYHKYPIQGNDTEASFKQLASCLRNGMVMFAHMGEKYFQRANYTMETLRSIVQDMEVCFLKNNLVTRDGNVALAIIRWFRSTFFR
ncbi:uncharacterized protein LOC135375831 [Ornithodoros turicata]|uniref:uncharacterized protein LOC135375831 n=1 Tax=Ornithodoros turicata TaxID=34597 RepID=UPI003138AAF2